MTLVIAEEGTQRAMKVLGRELEALIPGSMVVQSQGTFEPRKQDLPVIHLSWRQRSTGFLTRLEYPVAILAEPTAYTFTPKVVGIQQGNQADILFDSTADFSHVVVGDKARNRTRDAIGTVVQIIDRTQLRCSGVTFTNGDAYDIHWAIDAMKHYTMDRKAVVVLDVYAHPKAQYGTNGLALDELERIIAGHVWTVIRESLQEVYVEVLELERVSDASGIIASGLGADWYARATLELTLVIGDGVAVRKPTVERVPIPATPRYTEAEAQAGKSGFVEKLLRR